MTLSNERDERVRLIRYPGESDADMYWVKFDDDTQPIRQVKVVRVTH
jgi:hypothetical protein